MLPPTTPTSVFQNRAPTTPRVLFSANTDKCHIQPPPIVSVSTKTRKQHHCDTGTVVKRDIKTTTATLSPFICLFPPLASSYLLSQCPAAAPYLLFASKSLPRAPLPPPSASTTPTSKPYWSPTKWEAPVSAASVQISTLGSTRGCAQRTRRKTTRRKYKGF